MCSECLLKSPFVHTFGRDGRTLVHHTHCDGFIIIIQCKVHRNEVYAFMIPLPPQTDLA